MLGALLVVKVQSPLLEFRFFPCGIGHFAGPTVNFVAGRSTKANAVPHTLGPRLRGKIDDIVAILKCI